ncbi:unnamed protein product [Pleuronectes platessa]|uniref:Uncharacterized protein n=1 Tax=Pleuronectes platessa TaxID=8262 RepID=A0A9N7Z0E3_PLEPL|nr:unnamed protein product [Pleuronectes platessa]
MSSGAGRDSHRLDWNSIRKEQPQQLNLDISVMSLPAVVSPSGCWGLPVAPAAVSKQMSERVPTPLAELPKPPAALEASAPALSKGGFALRATMQYPPPHHLPSPSTTHPFPAQKDMTGQKKESPHL